MTAHGTPRVLVVEDEAMLLEIVKLELEDHGFAVVSAMTAESAMRILEGDETIDLLFTDIKLPGPINGFRLAESAQRLRSGLPVLYATGYTDESPAGIESSHFFLKPYSIAKVIEKTCALIAARGSSSSSM